MPEPLSKLLPIYIEIHQPGDKGDFFVNVYDGKNRTKITENRLKEDRSYLEYVYTQRLLEGGAGAAAAGDNTPAAEVQAKQRHDDLVRYGQSLYRDLFGKGDAFKRYISKQPHLKDGAHLVLRLHSTATELWNTPWEYMHDGTQFVGIQPQYPILRSLMDAKLERDNLDLSVLPCPLRILMVLSHPKDAMPLNIDTEIAMIRRAVKKAEDAGRIEIDFVEDGTLENLEFALRDGDYHILHYSGHGAVAPHGSFLVMEDEEGMSRPVFLHQILPLIQKTENLRFVFLNACKAGTITAMKATSGIATGLLQAVPAVLAMQFSVQDNSAGVLAEAFYGSLGRGQTLEEALHSTRRTMHKTNPSFADWGVPALYTHRPNIRLLDTRVKPALPQKRKGFELSALPTSDPFVGRHDDQRTMRAALGNFVVHSLYIWGMAGIGKSALVRQVIERTGQRDLLKDVLVLRCDTLELNQVVARISQWIGQHFPKTEPILKDSRLSPVKRLEAAAQHVRGKRVLLVLDGMEHLMQPQADRHGEFPHPLLTDYFKTLATASWTILTIFTSRLRWAQLSELPPEHCTEIHLTSLNLIDVMFLLQNLTHLKSVEGKSVGEFYRRVGGHPMTMHYVNSYLGKNPQNNPLNDPQLPLRLAAWWHKLFLADVFQKLKPEEREALRLLSVHGDTFNAQHVQLLVKLPSQEDAENIMVSWESLSLATFDGTDEDETPWYSVPELVQTYVTSQLKPDKLQRSHTEVARMTQRSFFLNAQRRFERIGGPEPEEKNEFQSVLDDLRLMVKRMHVPAARRYLQMAYTWHTHFREAGDHTRANEVALALLPSLWLLQDHEPGRKLVEELLKQTTTKSEAHVMARFWEASYALEAGQLSKSLTLLQAVEKLAVQFKLLKMLPLIYERQGEVYRNQGNHAEANRLWQKALQTQQRAKNTAGMGNALFYMGENAHFHGDALQAVRHIEGALDLFSKSDQIHVDLRLVARLLLYRGHIFRKIKNDAAALERYSDTLKLGEQLNDGYLIGKGLESLGYCYTLLGQYDIAAKYLLNAVDVYEKLEDKASLAVAQTRLAQVYDFKGNPSEALVFCERALQLAAQYAPTAIRQTEDLLGKLRRKKRWGI